MTSPTIKKQYKHIIVGAGPAGLQIGYCLQKAGEEYLILEKGNTPGEFYKKYPVHRKLISINKKYTGNDNKEFNLRHDWNSLLADTGEAFTDYSDEYYPNAEDMVQYLTDFREEHSLNIKTSTAVYKIEKTVSGYCINDDEYRCEKLIIASGVVPNIPDIAGIEYALGYEDVSIEKETFKNKNVLIIGKGNSAFETANHITDVAACIHMIGRSELQQAYSTHYPGHLRSVNSEFLDTYQLKSLNAILQYQESDVLEIKKNSNKYRLYINGNDDGACSYDYVIRCTGFKFDSSIFYGMSLDIENNLPVLTPKFESINAPNLFFAGTLIQNLSYRKSTLAFIHGFRYAARSMVNIITDNWPVSLLTKPELDNHIINRISTSSGLVQLYSYLCDAVIPDGDTYKYIEEVPINYLLQVQRGNFFTIHMEYGFTEEDDIFAEDRVRQYNKYGYASKFLHPVIRRYIKHTPGDKQKTLLKCTCGKWVEKPYILEQIPPCKKGNSPWVPDISCPACNSNIKRSLKTLKCIDSTKNNKIYEHHIPEDLQIRFDDAYTGDDFYTGPLRSFLKEMCNE
ncbi:MAG: pyridine nucleotide-disulfide oxidoreductase [Rhodospirillaceae bacterium]|nr:pyridine nucleotide-disulfide oxidoreductase [Rhodospirillaceae bacterium]